MLINSDIKGVIWKIFVMCMSKIKFTSIKDTIESIPIRVVDIKDSTESFLFFVKKYTDIGINTIIDITRISVVIFS